MFRADPAHLAPEDGQGPRLHRGRPWGRSGFTTAPRGSGCALAPQFLHPRPQAGLGPSRGQGSVPRTSALPGLCLTQRQLSLILGCRLSLLHPHAPVRRGGRLAPPDSGQQTPATPGVVTEQDTRDTHLSGQWEGRRTPTSLPGGGGDLLTAQPPPKALRVFPLGRSLPPPGADTRPLSSFVPLSCLSQGRPPSGPGCSLALGLTRPCLRQGRGSSPGDNDALCLHLWRLRLPPAPEP